MRSSPLKAGAIFGAISVAILFFLPPKLLEANIGPIWLVVVAGLLSGAVTGGLFGFGASLSQRQHTPISIIFAAALFFAMSYSLNLLLSDTGLGNGVLFYSLLAMYAVLAGWGCARRHKAEPDDASRA